MSRIWNKILVELYIHSFISKEELFSFERQEKEINFLFCKLFREKKLNQLFFTTQRGGKEIMVKDNKRPLLSFRFQDLHKTGNLSLIKLTFILKRLFTDKRIPFFVLHQFPLKLNIYFWIKQALGNCCEKSISMNFLTVCSLSLIIIMIFLYSEYYV